MTLTELIITLKQNKIHFRTDGQQLMVSPVEAITPALAAEIKAHRSGLMAALTNPTIIYDQAELWGIMPPTFERLADGRIKASYADQFEFRIHLEQVLDRRFAYELSLSMRDAGEALGGVTQ